MHPFLDTSKLTDEEIIDKLGKAYTFMNYQKNLGHTPAVVSIKEVIQSLEDERRKRISRIMDEESKRKNPKFLDSIELGNLED